MEYLKFIGEILLLLMYFFFYIRLLGHKEQREASPIDLVYMVLFVNVGWDMLLEPEYNMIHIFFALFVLTGVFWVIDYISYRSKRAERIFVGKAEFIIKDGKLVEETMKSERISQQELRAMLRQEGAFNIEEVETAILEVDGGVSVRLKGEGHE